MDNIQEIKSRLTILEIVSGYIRVEKSGTQYKARCPFHNERTPSFYVSPSRQNYHCFGCGESGDIFKFVEKMENLEFKEVLRMLAERAGVKLSKLKKEDDGRMLTLMNHAKQFFEVTLNTSIDAKKYIHDRGLSDDSIKEYEIGFAKKEWRLLFVHLMTLGYTDTECVESGLVIKTDDGKYYDRFRGRIMFPIRNISGYTVGFTGRVMPEYDDGMSGKYVNTPETKLYHKSKILFNYDKARKFIADNHEVILVEGQMDVIMSAQAGIKNVVAVSGTAFTEEQVKMISRLADSVVLAFDNDSAGKKASDRASIMCAYGGLQIYTVDIKEKDIADMVLNDANEWHKVYKNKVSLVESLAKNINNIKEEREKINYVKESVVPYLKAISSPLERDFATNTFSRISGISSEALKSEIEKHISQDVFNGLKSDIMNGENVSDTKNKIQLNTKEKLYQELSILKKELKIEDDFVLEEEIPDEVREKEINKLERVMALNIDYYEGVMKTYKKMLYDEEHKKRSINNEIDSVQELINSAKVIHKTK